MDNLVPQFVRFLHQSKGDPTAYLEILAKFYRQALIITKSNNDVASTDWDTMQAGVTTELEDRFPICHFVFSTIEVDPFAY